MAPREDPYPNDMTLRERHSLLLTSIAANPEDPHSRRYNVRRGSDGLEVFEAKFTRDVDGDVEFHGYPCTSVPIKVLRAFRDKAWISESEYRSMARKLGW